MPRSNRTIKVARVEIDTGHWQRTAGDHVWILRRAGIDSTRIEQEISKVFTAISSPSKILRPGAGYPGISANLGALAT